MATIGIFTSEGDGFSSAVSTLTLSAKVRIRRAEQASAKAPDFRLLAERAEIGVIGPHWVVRGEC